MCFNSVVYIIKAAQLLTHLLSIAMEGHIGVMPCLSGRFIHRRLLIRNLNVSITHPSSLVNSGSENPMTLALLGELFIPHQ